MAAENPPRPIDCLETKEYIAGLRRRIEVQNDQMEHLAGQVHVLLGRVKHLQDEIEKFSLDLAIKNEEVPPAWQEVKK